MGALRCDGARDAGALRRFRACGHHQQHLGQGACTSKNFKGLRITMRHWVVPPVVTPRDPRPVTLKYFGSFFWMALEVLIDLLRNKARPYLFSNTLAPSVAGASLEVFKMLSKSADLLSRLQAQRGAVPHLHEGLALKLTLKERNEKWLCEAAGFKLSGHERLCKEIIGLGDDALGAVPSSP